MVELGADEILPQGDILVEHVDHLPTGLKDVTPKNGKIVVAHSEDGHHHMVTSKTARLMRGEDPFVCYLQVSEGFEDLIHHRQVNPHETIRIHRSVKITRQHEGTPEGLRQVND